MGGVGCPRVKFASSVSRVLLLGLMIALIALNASLDRHLWQNLGAIRLFRSLDPEQHVVRKEAAAAGELTRTEMLLNSASIRGSETASVYRLMLTLSLASGDLATAETWDGRPGTKIQAIQWFYSDWDKSTRSRAGVTKQSTLGDQ